MRPSWIYVTAVNVMMYLSQVFDVDVVDAVDVFIPQKDRSFQQR